MFFQFKQGRKAFDAGDFTVAFRILLPVAVEGDVQAQYAVGYMYYYGLGVTEDTESGIFWIKKAAYKGYPPAVNALAEIASKKK